MPTLIAEAVLYVVEVWGVSAATAVAVANVVITGVYYAAASALINAAVKALSPSQPRGAGRGMEVNVTDATAPARILYGTVKVGGVNVIPPFNSGGNGEVLHQVLALAGHEVDSITDVYFDQEQITSASIGSITGATTDGLVSAGKYANAAYIRRYTGTSTQTRDFRLNNAFPTAFGTDFRGRGIAYVALDFIFNQDVYPSGLPSASFVVKGKKVYDPRLDVTPGASPTNPSYIAWSDNSALVLADYLLSPLGGEFDSTEIDWSLVVAAANICDASLSGGNAPPSGAQARYTCNLLLQATDDFLGNCKLITDTMLGRFVFRDGQWRIYAGAWTSPVHNMDQKCFVGPVSIQASSPRDQRYNTVRAFFVNPAKNWQRVECYPRVNATYKTNDGSEGIAKEIEIPGVTNEYRAQYISEILLRQSRNQIQITGPMGPQWQRLALYETVSFDWPDMGWSSKTFRVVGYSLNPNGSVDVGLAEEQSGDWTDLTTAEYNNPSTSTLPTTNPTTPSAPQNFVALLFNGVLKFDWDRPTIEPVDTKYRIVRAPGSASAVQSGTEIWRGNATGVLLPITDPFSRYWYHVQAMVNSNLGPYTPNTFGLGLMPYPMADNTFYTQRLNPDAEFLYASNSYWGGIFGSVFSLSPTGGQIAGRCIVTGSQQGVVRNIQAQYVNSLSGNFYPVKNGESVNVTVRWRRTSALTGSGGLNLFLNAANKAGNYTLQLIGGTSNDFLYTNTFALNTWYTKVWSVQILSNSVHVLSPPELRLSNSDHLRSGTIEIDYFDCRVFPGLATP